MKLFSSFLMLKKFKKKKLMETRKEKLKKAAARDGRDDVGDQESSVFLLSMYGHFNWWKTMCDRKQGKRREG